METIKKSLPYWAAITAGVYLLPLLIQNTGIAMLILLILFPFLYFFCSFIHGLRRGLRAGYLAGAAVLFVPSLWIYYNQSAWVYIIIYGLIACLGEFLGAVIRKSGKKYKREKRKN